eukprot:2817018-Rhodomonas_salina.1
MHITAVRFNAPDTRQPWTLDLGPHTPNTPTLQHAKRSRASNAKSHCNPPSTLGAIPNTEHRTPNTEHRTPNAATSTAPADKLHLRLDQLHDLLGVGLLLPYTPHAQHP